MSLIISRWNSSVATKPILSWFRSVLSKGQMKTHLCDDVSCSKCLSFSATIEQEHYVIYFRRLFCFVFKIICSFLPLISQLPQRLKQVNQVGRIILTSFGHWFKNLNEKRGKMNIYWLHALCLAFDMSFHLTSQQMQWLNVY